MPSSPLPHWTVAAPEAGVRLAAFLAHAERLGTRGRAVAALERGKVFVNDAEATRADTARRLQAGDVVRVWMDRPGSARRRLGAFRAGGLNVLHEDDDLIVLDKPAGLLAVPLDRREGAASAYSYVEDHLRSHKRKPFVVHRIDRDTSGLVVFAKHPRARLRLKEQFADREPERVYRAVMYGHPKPTTGVWRDRVVWDRRALVQKEVEPDDPTGTEAICRYSVLEQFAEASLVDVRLHTGRQNQIRIQARLHGHPLVGERRYVGRPDEQRAPIAFPRQALHAYRLSFKHPADGRRLTFEAPLPDDFAGLLTRLRRDVSHGVTPPERSFRKPRRR